jgi:KaiC/GvpD/RAD55 family RecA-like ATPase
MTPIHLASHGVDATHHGRITNGNASVAPEAFKPNKTSETIARNDDLRNETTREFKKLLLASSSSGALGELAGLATDTPCKDLMQEYCPDALIHPPKAPVVPILRYQVKTADDMCKLPPFQWWVKNVLPSRGLAVIYGPSGSGKSFLVLDMLHSLAFGCAWFGHKVKQCSVTYVALEGEAGVAGRIKAYVSMHGSTSSDIVYIAQPVTLIEADDINELAKAILAAGTSDVVVIDTLSRAIAGLDENDSKAMGQIIASAKMLQEMIGGLLLFIHHTGKDASKGMRGHSSLHAAVDCAIEVKRTGDNHEWILAKSKDGEDGASHSFKLEVVSLGVDADGDAITSCVVVPNQSAQAVQKKMPKLASNQTIALNALEEPMCKSVDIDQEGAPPGRHCLRFDEVIAIVAPLMPAAAKHQKERAKVAITGLVGKGVLSEDGEWLFRNQSL